MTKASAKNALIMIGGYNFSAYSTQWEEAITVPPSEVTGFGDESHNFIATLPQAQVNVNMLWDATATTGVNAILRPLSYSKNITIIPEGYALGRRSLSMPFLQGNFTTTGNASGEAIQAGSLAFVTTGSAGFEMGWVLAHATITETATGTGVLDPGDAAITATCAGVLHIWDTVTLDSYEIKIQDSANNADWDDLVTFTLDGTALNSERVAVASGTVNKYRRVVATRTGSAGETLGYTVHFWHGLDTS